MSPQNDDFLFAQEAQRRGYVSEEQIDEAFRLQKRMTEELQIDERLGVILVKRGWLGEEQARRVQARLEPNTEQDEIEGYRFIEKVGHGAMGTVYKAVHLGLQRPVAVKILRRDLARDQIQVERLKEEAKLLASLDHPNIVRALDAGESRGFPFVVMEYVEGDTLKERIARDGPMHEIDALRIARGIADALERARRMGVVHRDVKPGNIICAIKDDEPKLMDLGLAKGPVDLGLTQHGSTVGTPQYISPEQAQDPRKADIRSDIYSLGATLYALVTGRPPFQGSTLAEILTKVLYEAPVPPRVLNKKVSPEVGYLIERMMLKDPALRYRTPADVVHDIDEILAGRSIIPEGFTGNWEAYLLRQKIRRWIRVAATAAVVIVLLTAGTVFVTKRIERGRAMEAGRDEIFVALQDLGPVPIDTQAEVHEKWQSAKALRERMEDLQPERYARLVDMEDRLKRETQWFADLDERSDRLDDLVRQKDFAKAVEILERMILGIPGSADSPAARAIQKRKANVQLASDAHLEEIWNEHFGRPARTVEELIQMHEAYEVALGSGFWQSQGVRDARDTTRRALTALAAIREDMGGIDAEFSVESLSEQVRRLEWALISNSYHPARLDVEERARRAWRTLDDEDWLPWKGWIDSLVESRLSALERQIDTQIEQHADAVLREARQVFEEGQSTDALRKLGVLARAAEAAGRMGIRSRALKQQMSFQDRFDRELERAEGRLRAFEDEVLALLKEGDPQGIHKAVTSTLRNTGVRWPYRREVEKAFALELALRQLYDKAYDELIELATDRGGLLRNVHLRNGDVDSRWVLKPGQDRSTWTVTVAGMVNQDGRKRSLTEVAPYQLAEWAQRGALPLPPLLRAVVALGSLPETTNDLRPVLRHLDEAYRAFDDAPYKGALYERVKKEFGEAVSEQRRREERARSAYNDAGYAFNPEKEYPTALFLLNLLLEPLSLLRYTDFFEQQEALIESLYAQVAKHVANEKLSLRFPGAELTLQGETTRVAIDFNDQLQLQTLRMHGARATGVREPVKTDHRVISPRGEKQDWRFHLLRGMDGLTRDHPFVLPCIFDPAETIRFEFDLHTLDSPFFLLVDIDGLQVGVLSADPGGYTYRDRWRLPEDVPMIKSDESRPTVGFYGRGRGVAFHAGKGFRDPRAWKWPTLGFGRKYESWAPERRDREMEMKKQKELFCFEQSQVYRVTVLREQGRITLFVGGKEVLSKSDSDWSRIGRYSDKDPYIRNKGTGLLQILTWTPQAIDNLVMEGVVLDHYRAK